MACDGRYADNNSGGSKQQIVDYTMRSTNAIVEVQSNITPTDKRINGAVIENLVIDGLSLSNGATGILLENVCNCLIRNITIRNCEVGIRVKLTSASNGVGSHGNRFEHIWMSNVKTGIVFEGVSGAKDFSYTSIDDVSINLVSNTSSAVGINIGLNASLCCGFVRGVVWLGSSGGKGLDVSGELRYSLVNLGVERTSSVGYGVVVNSGGKVLDNQSFLLKALGFSSSAIINNSGNNYDGGITPFT